MDISLGRDIEVGVPAATTSGKVSAIDTDCGQYGFAQALQLAHDKSRSPEEMKSNLRALAQRFSKVIIPDESNQPLEA